MKKLLTLLLCLLAFRCFGVVLTNYPGGYVVILTDQTGLTNTTLRVRNNGTLFYIGDGSGLISLNGGAIASGTIPFARLPSNVGTNFVVNGGSATFVNGNWTLFPPAGGGGGGGGGGGTNTLDEVLQAGNTSPSVPDLHLGQGGGSDAVLYLNNDTVSEESYVGVVGGHIQLSVNGNTLKIGSDATFEINGQPVWNGGNMGSGSTLDADLLDGQDGTYYFSPANMGPGSGLDADTLDGFDSTDFLTAVPTWDATLAAGNGTTHDVIINDNSSTTRYLRWDNAGYDHRIWNEHNDPLGEMFHEVVGSGVYFTNRFWEAGQRLSLNAPSDGQFLVYDNASGTWTNKTIAAGGLSAVIGVGAAVVNQSGDTATITVNNATSLTAGTLAIARTHSAFGTNILVNGGSASYNSGDRTWTLFPAAAAGDNLGNHLATQNLNAGGFSVSNVNVVALQDVASGGKLQFGPTVAYPILLTDAGGLDPYWSRYNGQPTNLMWHAGNDGAGSGLDADLLDGLDSSAFSLSGHTHTSFDWLTINNGTFTGTQNNTGTITGGRVLANLTGSTGFPTISITLTNDHGLDAGSITGASPGSVFGIGTKQTSSGGSGNATWSAVAGYGGATNFNWDAEFGWLTVSNPVLQVTRPVAFANARAFASTNGWNEGWTNSVSPPSPWAAINTSGMLFTNAGNMLHIKASTNSADTQVHTYVRTITASNTSWTAIWQVSDILVPKAGTDSAIWWGFAETTNGAYRGIGYRMISSSPFTTLRGFSWTTPTSSRATFAADITDPNFAIVYLPYVSAARVDYDGSATSKWYVSSAPIGAPYLWRQVAARTNQTILPTAICSGGVYDSGCQGVSAAFKLQIFNQPAFAAPGDP